MQHLSRRHFLLAAGAAGGATFEQGCAINPDSPNSISPKAQALTLSSTTTPETTAVKLGYIAIAESAPLIIAREKGFLLATA